MPKTSGSDDHNPAASSPSEIRMGETGVCSFWFMLRNSMLWHSTIFKTVCTGGLAPVSLVCFQTYIFPLSTPFFFWHCASLMFQHTSQKHIGFVLCGTTFKYFQIVGQKYSKFGDNTHIIPTDCILCNYVCIFSMLFVHLNIFPFILKITDFDNSLSFLHPLWHTVIYFVILVEP